MLMQQAHHHDEEEEEERMKKKMKLWLFQIMLHQFDLALLYHSYSSVTCLSTHM